MSDIIVSLLPAVTQMKSGEIMTRQLTLSSHLLPLVWAVTAHQALEQTEHRQHSKLEQASWQPSHVALSFLTAVLGCVFSNQQIRIWKVHLMLCKLLSCYHNQRVNCENSNIQIVISKQGPMAGVTSWGTREGSNSKPMECELTQGHWCQNLVK